MPDDKASPRKTKRAPDRPTIWAEGSQKPKFDLRAFASASLHFTRQDLGTILRAAASGTTAFAATVTSGRYRVPADRLGRAAKLVPSHQRVGGWISTAARILDQAGLTARPGPDSAGESLFVRTAPPAPAPEPAPIIAETVPTPPPDDPAPHAPVTLAEPAAEDSATLAAIRAALGSAPPPDAASPASEMRPPAMPTPASSPSPLGATLISLTGTVLGWGVTVLSLPYGMLRATLAHLNGTDLRRIRDEA